MAPSSDAMQVAADALAEIPLPDVLMPTTLQEGGAADDAPQSPGHESGAHPTKNGAPSPSYGEKGEEPSASRDSTDSENRPIFNIRDPDINNFMTWGPNTFPNTQFYRAFLFSQPFLHHKFLNSKINSRVLLSLI